MLAAGFPQRSPVFPLCLSLRILGISSCAGGDWKNTSVGTLCKKHILLRPLDKVIAFVEKRFTERFTDVYGWFEAGFQGICAGD